MEDCEDRLRTMLGNIFRLRTLWSLCHGGSVPGGSVSGGSVPGSSVLGGSVPGGSVPPLKWASFDQKPSWFNNAGMKSLYARKGSRVVGAREDHHGTRQRYTIMTSVLSWTHKTDNEPPPCALLFKGESDRAFDSYVRTVCRMHLHVVDTCQ